MLGMFLRISCLLLDFGVVLLRKEGNTARLKPPKRNQNKNPSAVPKADPPKAPLVGQPYGSGYADDSIRVQIGPDQSLRVQQSPLKGEQFLFVRFPSAGRRPWFPRITASSSGASNIRRTPSASAGPMGFIIPSSLSWASGSIWFRGLPIKSSTTAKACKSANCKIPSCSWSMMPRKPPTSRSGTAIGPSHSLRTMTPSQRTCRAWAER